MLLTSRRAFLGGLISALAAPAIVHAANIMPVRNVLILPEPGFDSFDALMPDGMQYQWVDTNKICVGLDFAWEPVPASRFNGRFAIAGDTVRVGDCVLVERPKAACDAARAKEINAAHRMVTDWAGRCMANGFEVGVRYSQPTTVDFTRITDFGGIS